jgi:hypothetical protein
MQKNCPKPQKKKNQQDVKPKNTTSFKKKKKDKEKGNCFTCGKIRHFARLPRCEVEAEEISKHD